MNESKKHIALVTTWFPPRTGVAVNRMSAFVKYLDKSKFDISVITLKLKNENGFEKIENSEIHRLKNGSLIHVSPTIAGEPRFVHNMKVLWNVILNFFKPFEYSSWKKTAVKILEKINQKNKIDLLLSSFSPPEAHLVAIDFCKIHPSTPWIADMRDEMSKNPHESKRINKKLSRIETEINNHAKAVLSVSEPILNDFKTLMPRVNFFEEIRNGFDHDIKPLNNFNDVFTIAYSGTFYGIRKPDVFFQALKAFTIKAKAEVKLKFIGTNKNFKLPDEFLQVSEFIPPLSYIKAIEIIAAADAMLFIQPIVERKGVFTGKLFDYISLMKPIIAACDTNDVAARLIAETNSGFISDFNNVDEVEKAITQAYWLWKDRKQLSFKKEKIASLHRKYQVSKLEKLIDKLLQE